MSTISSLSNSSNAWAPVNAQRSQMQTKMFAKIDTDSSGGVDKTELQTVFANASQKTGVSLDAEKLFTTMDSNADGSLSSDELASGLKDVMPPPPSTLAFAQGRSSNTGEHDLFAKVDGNSDGSVDQAEMTAFTDKMKAETGRDSPTSFAKLDSDSDGKLTQDEFDAGRPTDITKGEAGVEAANRAPPPPGGPGGAKGAPQSNATDSTYYDPLDTNQDGTVSELERLAGALKEFVSTSDSESSSTSNDAILKLAKLVYEQISSGNTSQSTSTLDAVA